MDIREILASQAPDGSMAAFRALEQAAAMLQEAAESGWPEERLIDTWEDVAAYAWQQAAAHHAAPSPVDLYELINTASNARYNNASRG